MTLAQHNYICKYVGQRIKERRKTLNLNQGELAREMGLSPQQIQKYESGTNQISVTRLLQFAKILNTPPSYFHEGIKLDDVIGVQIETDLIQRERSQALEVTLVEDNPSDIILFKKLLQKLDEEIALHYIEDAETVMDFLHNHSTKYGKKRPDIILLDLSLPKIDGIQLLERIKKERLLMDLPVIMLTNSVSKKEMQKAYQLGAAGFIQKSIDPEKFYESIKIAMNYWTKAVVLPQM